MRNNKRELAGLAVAIQSRRERNSRKYGRRVVERYRDRTRASILRACSGRNEYTRVSTEASDPSHDGLTGLALTFELPLSLPKRQDELVFIQCEYMIDLVASLFNVSSREIRFQRRATTEICRVRQIAMYVAHVSLQLNMSEIADGFGRDRSTVVHACHLVEDMRDDPEFDAIICGIERLAGALRAVENQARGAVHGN